VLPRTAQARSRIAAAPDVVLLDVRLPDGSNGEHMSTSFALGLPRVSRGYFVLTADDREALSAAVIAGTPPAMSPGGV
jgi:DNA-binding NarL/FixJ family response regulator